MATVDIPEDIGDALILFLANEKGKFALQLGLTLPPDQQYAFERGIDKGWFTLVDLSLVSVSPHAGYMRVFRLTVDGKRRKAALERKQARNHR